MPNRKSMLPAAYVCVSVWVCVSRQFWRPEVLSWEKCVFACMSVWERDRKVSTHRPKANSCQGKPNSFSPFAVFPISKSMSLLSLAVKPISLASYAITAPQPQDSLQELGSILIQDVDSLQFAEHKFLSSIAQKKLPKGPQRNAFRHLLHIIHLWRCVLAIQWRCTKTRYFTDIYSI